MKKRNIQFTVMAIALMISLFLLDFSTGKLGDYIITKLPDNSGQIAKEVYRMDRLNTDIVILGSSRGLHHYVTIPLKDSINQYTKGSYTAFNASIRGKAIDCNSCAAESIMDRYAPKLLIFEVSEYEFSGDYINTDMDFLAPLYTSNRFAKQYIDSLVWGKKIKYFSGFYRYNWKIPQIASSFFLKNEATGYEPIFHVMEEIPEFQMESPVEINKFSLHHFFRVLQTAKEKDINLIVVTSPWFRPGINNTALPNFCAQYDIPYIDMSNLELFNAHPELFQDPKHLNDKGAHIFTGILFDNLKPYLSNMIK